MLVIVWYPECVSSICKLCPGWACVECGVEGAGLGGRPKKTWRYIVGKDCRACGLNGEDAMEHGEWRKRMGYLMTTIDVRG